MKPMLKTCLLCCLASSACSLDTTPPQKRNPERTMIAWMPDRISVPDASQSMEDAGHDDHDAPAVTTGSGSAGAKADPSKMPTAGKRADNLAAGSGGAGKPAPMQPSASGSPADAGMLADAQVPMMQAGSSAGAAAGSGGMSGAGGAESPTGSRNNLIDAVAGAIQGSGQAVVDLPGLLVAWRAMAASGEGLSAPFVTMLMNALDKSGACLRDQRTCASACAQVAADCKECAADKACSDAVRGVCGAYVASCWGQVTGTGGTAGTAGMMNMNMRP